MPFQHAHNPHPDGLRARAEARLANAAVPSVDTALGDSLKLVHELQVHQVELQMQQAELELSKAELKAALARQQWLFDQAPVGYCSVDAEGRVRDANPMAASLLRQDPQCLPGQRLEALFTEAGAATVGALLRHVAAWPVPHTAEAALQGEPEVLLELRARAAPDGQGTVVALMDATARRRAEDQRQRAELAEGLNQARAVFLSEMNHELRTPLSAVIGLSELMLRGREPLTERQHQWLSQIEQSGRHMLALAGDALDLARIDASHLDLAAEAVDVQALLAEVLAMVSGAAATNDVTLHLQPAPGPGCAVLADPRRLRQVLLNLLSNAVKYNRPGGLVDVGLQVQAGTVAVQVQDTGGGLTEAQLQRAFQPFQRLGAERSKIEGTGLGLALSRRLAEAMGGTLSLASMVGSGTTATLVLRAAG